MTTEIKQVDLDKYSRLKSDKLRYEQALQNLVNGCQPSVVIAGCFYDCHRALVMAAIKEKLDWINNELDNFPFKIV